MFERVEFMLGGYLELVFIMRFDYLGGRLDLRRVLVKYMFWDIF